MNVKKIAKKGLSIIALSAILCTAVLPHGFHANAAPPNSITVETLESLSYSYRVSNSTWTNTIGMRKANNKPIYCFDNDKDGPFHDATYVLDQQADNYTYSVLWHSRNLYGDNLNQEQYFATQLCVWQKPYMTNGTVGQDAASQRCLDMAKQIRNAAINNPKTPNTAVATCSVSQISGGSISGSNYIVGTYQVNTNASDYTISVHTGYSTSGTTFTKLSNKRFRITIPLNNITGGYYVRADITASVTNDAAYIYSSQSNPSWQRMVIMDSGTSTKFIRFEEQQDVPEGKINIYKRDSETNALLSGATFKIINKSTNEVYFTQTNREGYAYIDNLPIGIYKVEEITAPGGYVIGNNVWDNIQITETDTTHTFTAYNAPQVGRITVYKRDAETGTIPQGDATLHGSQFNIVDSLGNVVQTLTLSGTSATTGNLPLGTYSVVETQAPTGYKLAAPVSVTLSPDDQTVEVVSESVTVNDEVIKGNIRINKTGDRKLGVTDDGTTPSLSGVEFEVRLKSSDALIDTITTDNNGIATTGDLPYGTYTITETKGKTGYKTSESVDVVINSEGTQTINLVNEAYASEITIVKKDATTDKVIPAAGTEFGIKDVNGNWIEQNGTHIFVTDNTGTVVLPQPLTYGNYTLVEIKAPFGYTLNTTPVSFTVEADDVPIVLEMKNEPTRGTITVTKTGEILSSIGDNNTPIYATDSLSNAEFDIVAVNDVVTPDGTIRYLAGTIVDTLRTDSSGQDTTIPLFLGTYDIIETKAPSGFVLDSTPRSVTLVYESQNVALVNESLTLNNARQKVSISFNKNFETESGQTESPHSATTFGVFAAEDIVANDGTMIPRDGLIEILTVNTDGSVSSSADLPIAVYYIKELTTHDGYVLDDSEYVVVYDSYDQNTTTIQGKLNGDTMISNLLKRGDLVVEKTAEGDNLEGFEFRIHGTTVVGTVYDQTFTTDTEGKITVSGLLVGTYEIVELSNDKTVGYIIPDAQTVVLDKEDTFTINFDNRYERHTLTIKKTSEDGVLEGFIFRVTGTTVIGTEYDETFVTDAEGQIVIEGLLLGTYTITEVSNSVSIPYVIPEPQTIDITAGATEPFEVYIYNALLRGSTDLIKVDSRTGEPLSGVQFVITDATGTVIATLTTDENGIANTGNLPYGIYYIVEIKAPEGYVLDNTQHEFSITEHKQVVEFRLVNSKISGNIEIRKTDENNLPISGVEFTVINQETNEVIEVLTTDKDGYAISGKLDYGNYILRETKTPDGYLPADDQYFSITQDEELISYAIVNTRSPITGESAPTTAFVLLIASIIMIVLILAIKGKMVKALVKAKH